MRLRANAVAIATGILWFTLTSAEPQSSKRTDGNWWRSQDRSVRIAYVAGFFDGMELGKNFSYWKFAKDQRAGECTLEVNDSYNEFTARYFSNVTNVQISDGLDSFYSDYRNRSIPVHSAVWLVVNEIAGTPREEIDSMTENFRRLLIE